MTIRNLGTKMIQSSGRSRGGAQGGRTTPLFLDQTEVQRADKIFLETTPPPPPPSQGLDLALQRQ